MCKGNYNVACTFRQIVDLADDKLIQYLLKPKLKHSIHIKHSLVGHCVSEEQYGTDEFHRR